MTKSCLHQTEPSAYGDALAFLYDRVDYERMASGVSRYPFGLQRMRTLLCRLGLKKYLYDSGERGGGPVVHIAGTKGKGSTASMVSAGLTAAGLRTGLYTSPHLHDLGERFRVDGACCSETDVIGLVDRIRPVVAEMAGDDAGSPSFFELTTAMSLVHFDNHQCDVIVLEVGLGGRLDSTNVCASHVTAITSIGLDHQHVLGDTIEQIAAEKAGIIKRHVPVVSGVTEPASADVIERVARQHHAPLLRIGHEFSVQFTADKNWGSRLNYRAPALWPVDAPLPTDAPLPMEPSSAPSAPPLQDRQQVDLALEGEHQAGNAAVAIACIDLLRSQGVAVPPAAVADGLRQLRCIGRVERFRLPDDKIAIVDAAHNDDSIAALCDCLRRRYRDRPIAVVFGTSCDKVARPMLEALSEVASTMVLTQFQGNPRYQPTEVLMTCVPPSMLPSVRVIGNPIDAIRDGLEKTPVGGVLVVCGSFFLVAETRGYLAELARQRPG